MFYACIAGEWGVLRVAAQFCKPVLFKPSLRRQRRVYSWLLCLSYAVLAHSGISAVRMLSGLRFCRGSLRHEFFPAELQCVVTCLFHVGFRAAV